jgi:predicted nucleotidyltransferase
MEPSYVTPRIIFETVVGSRAYGTNLDESADYDRAGVMIPGESYFYGLEKFEQFMGFPEKDRVIYDIRKAVKLISDGNPNMMDLLWTPERCLVTMTKYWKKMIDNRDLFVSKRCRHTFSGYAVAQLLRIKVARRFLLNPPKIKPTRELFGLPPTSIFPTAQLKAIIYSAIGDFLIPEDKENFLSELDDVYADYIIPLFRRYVREDRRALALEYLQVGIKSQANTLKSLGPSYIKDEYLEEADKELRYYHASKEWEQYMEWKKHRNKYRAEIELKFKFDTKHANHLIRLYRMGKEILETGQVNVDRTNIDAEELKDIRRGAWTYEQVEEYSKSMDGKLDELYKTSTLQKTPQFNKINDLCVEVVKEFIHGWGK